MDEIRRAVRRARRRLHFIRGVAGALRAIFFLTIAAAGVLAVQRLLGVAIPWREVSIGLGAAVLAAGILAALLPPLSLLRAAAEIDARTGWKERVSSLLSLPSVQEPMERALMADVHERLTSLDVSTLLPLRFPRVARWLPLCALAIVGAWFLPKLQLADASAQEAARKKETERIAAAVEKLVKKAEDRKQKVEKNMERALSAERRLEKLAQQMQESGASRREILQELAAERARLREDKAAFEDSRAMAEKLQSLLESSNKKSDAGELGQMIREGRFKEVAEEMARMRQKLNEGSLTEEEKQQLMQELSSVMEKLADARSRQNQSEMSQAEQAMAQALEGLQNGNEQAMQGLQDLMGDLASDQAESQMLEGMMQDLESMADELAQGDNSCPTCGKKQEGLAQKGGT